ncbi:MAG: hypothetical protein Alis3KO_24570 [Aliiglaciecola sp.]
MFNSKNESLDSFQSGAMVTTPNREIIYVNSYFEQELNWQHDSLLGKSTDVLFTHSSKIFCESYLVPILFTEKKCEEMQLALLDGNGNRVPVIINAKVNDEGLVFWSFFNASKRDGLYQELLEARERLEQLSSTDDLTGLLNRRAFDERATIALEVASRSNQPVSAVLIDIDYFKKINDSYGHFEGDRVLRELGLLLQKFGRISDLIARYGGEEFLIILPDTDKEGAAILTQRIHSLVGQIFVGKNPITVSIGLCTYQGKSIALNSIYRQADDMLYLAKNNGRNRTECVVINEGT